MRDECPMESLGETDIAMLEDSDERFLLDSIEMLLLDIRSKIVRHQLWNYQYVTMKTLEESGTVLEF